MNIPGPPLDQEHLKYFRDQVEYSNPEFFRRIGYADFRDKTVLDIGCGHGALSIHIARSGAKRVVGLDTDMTRIKFAKNILELNYPQYRSVIDFECRDLASINEKFDLAISKDSFEHIDDLPKVMRRIAAVLKEDGLLIAGFSPLYFSPFGDHGRYLGRGRLIPWLPVLLPEPFLFRLASHVLKTPVRSAADVGLNKLTPRQFRGIVYVQGWTPVVLDYNNGQRMGMTLMRALRRVPFLEKFFTVSIYAQLRAPRNRLS